ncbi:MAG: DUF4340 domain-containing protein [Proteobacteria bacterium]|nr:DUF4340 domain-containing protein [Pseudomonadota bacterium]
MTPRSIAVLFIITLVAIAGAIGGVANRVNYQSSNLTGERVFPKLLENANSVSEMTVLQAGKNMTFRKQDGGWVLSESDGYPVDGRAVTKLIYGVSDLEYLERKTAREDRFEKLFLEDPTKADAKSHRVTLKDGAGKVLADVITGRSNSFLPQSTTGGAYIRLPGDKQTWLAKGLIDIGAEPRDWLQRDIVDFPPEQVLRVVTRLPGGETNAAVPDISAAAKPGDFVFESIPSGRKLKSRFAPRDQAALLGGFVLNDVRKASAVMLDPKDAYVSEFDVKGGIHATMWIWRKDGTDWMKLGIDYTGADANSAEAKKVAEIKRRTDGWAYIIPAYQADVISKTMEFMTEPDKPAS